MEEHLSWEHKQAELWDRVFQVTQDVAALADSLEDDAGGNVVREEMVRSAMAVGVELVRVNAAETRDEFEQHLTEARMKAVETDYWLRMAYVLQQREDVQRDLSGIITQYASIVDMLQKFSRHTRNEKDVLARHARGPRVT